MSGVHEPNNEFLAHLEWQLRTAHRRSDRFSTPVSANRRQKMKMIGLIVLSTFFGAGAVVASEEVQESKAQEILLIRIEGERRIAELQLEMVRVNLQEIQRRVEEGLLEEDVLLDVALSVRQGELHLDRLELDEEEIRLSGRPPRDEISAPLVGGRDFVSERLRLEEETARAQYASMQQRFAEILDREEAGAPDREQEMQARFALERAASHLTGLQDRLALRERFTTGELTAEGVETEKKKTEIRDELGQQELVYQQVMQFEEQIARRVEAGLERESQLTQIRFQVLQAEMRLETLRRTLEVLERVGYQGLSF